MSIQDILNGYKPQQPSGNQTFDEINPIEGFAKDVAYSAGPGMFGHEPDVTTGFGRDVEGFREAHPWGHIAAALAGGLGFYGAAGKALETIPAVNTALDALPMGDSILGGGIRAGAQIAPIESMRVVGAGLSGGDVKQTAEEGITDTGLALGLGGIAGAFRSAGKTEPSLAKLGLNIDMKDPPQVHLKAMQESLASGAIAEADKAPARAIIGDMKEAILSEGLGGKDKYVRGLEQGDPSAINELFKQPVVGEKDPDVITKRFIAGGKDFSDSATAEDALAAAGISSDLDAVQFPRMLAAATEKGGKEIQGAISKNLTSIAPDEYLGKEPEGLYVYAKKLEGDPAKPGADDRWLLTKTSEPQRFSDAAPWAGKQEEKSAWFQDQPVPKGSGDILDATQGLYNTLPIKGFYQATSGKSAAAGFDALAGKLGLSGESELMARAKNLLRENLAPAMNEYNNNPVAKYVYTLAKNAFSKADELTHSMVNGEERLAKGRSIFGGLVRGTEGSGEFRGGKAFKNIINSLSDNDFADFTKARAMAIPPEGLDEAVANRMISPAAAEALKEVDKMDSWMIEQTQATQKAVGEDGFSPIKGHYLLPHTWEGDIRVPIYNDSGKLVYYASGKNRAAAEKMAQGILDNNEVKGWYAGKWHTSDASNDSLLAQQVRVGSPEYLTAATLRAKLNAPVGSPQSFKVRTGVGGWKANFTKQELIENFERNVSQRNRYLAELATNKVLGTEKAKLGISDPSTLASVERRISSLAGRQGKINKMVNEVADSVFSPVLGKNTASKAARAINMTMLPLTIGAGNLQRPFIDMMNFMQTTLPRIAFTIGEQTSDASLRQAYSSLPVIDRTGMVKGSMNFLSPLKIMKQSFQLMKDPTDEFIEHANQALHSSTIDEWIGRNSGQALSLRKTLAGEEGWGDFLYKLSSYLPQTAWKLSRANSFAVGHILGKMMNLEGDGLFRFAKEFTDKTMFSYATADKPRVFTGPVGSVFGQFKNWTAHYIANMAEFASEGYNYNNWAPLLWQMGGTTALGGISSTALMPIGNSFSKWLTNKSLMENLYQASGGGSGDKKLGNTSDAIWMGLPAYLGVALNAGIDDPASDPSRTASMLFSFPQMARAQALGKAMGMAWDNFKATGQHPIDSQATRDLVIKALAPKTLANFIAQTNDDAMKSLNNGGKIAGNLNLAEKLMLDSGFMPKRIELAKEINEQLWQEKEEMNARIKTMGRLWNEAEKANAYDVLTKLNKEAMLAGIPIDRVLASANGLDRVEGKTQLERKAPQDTLRFNSLNIIAQ